MDWRQRNAGQGDKVDALSSHCFVFRFDVMNTLFYACQIQIRYVAPYCIVSANIIVVFIALKVSRAQMA